MAHDEGFVLAEIAGKVWEAWESDERFQILLIELLVKSDIRVVLDIVLFPQLLLFSLLLPFALVFQWKLIGPT